MTTSAPSAPGDFLPILGRTVALPLTFSVERQLGAEEILALASGEVQPELSAPPPLQRIRAVHHHAARLLAEGKNAVETAAAVGRTPQRIRDLEKDPAFAELVAYYMDQRTEVELEDGARIRSKLVDAAEFAVDEIQDRLEDDKKRKVIPIGELRQIAQLGLDRTVAPPRVAASAQAPPVAISFHIAGPGLPRTPEPKLGDDAKDITPAPSLEPSVEPK